MKMYTLEGLYIIIVDEPLQIPEDNTVCGYTDAPLKEYSIYMNGRSLYRAAVCAAPYSVHMCMCVSVIPLYVPLYKRMTVVLAACIFLCRLLYCSLLPVLTKDLSHQTPVAALLAHASVIAFEECI